jgi:hypothetical protein
MISRAAVRRAHRVIQAAYPYAIITGMPEQPSSPRAGARHEQPSSPGARVKSALLGVSWFAATISAFLIGFGVTGVSGTARPGLPRWQQPGLGAGLVGISAALLAFLIGAQISLVRDRSRHPNARYRSLHGFRYHTIQQSLRHNVRMSLILVLLAVLGLWLRHRYG